MTKTTKPSNYVFPLLAGSKNLLIFGIWQKVVQYTLSITHIHHAPKCFYIINLEESRALTGNDHVFS